MIIKNKDKQYLISFYPSEKDGLGFTYENHTSPDAPQKAFVKILIAAGFLGIISTFVFTPPADEFSASPDSTTAEDTSDQALAEDNDSNAKDANTASQLASVITAAPAAKVNPATMPSFASKALSALTSQRATEPEVKEPEKGESFITTESRTMTLSPEADQKNKEITVKVKSGDNVVSMLRKQGISNLEANRASLALDKIFKLKNLRPNQTLTIVKNSGLFSVTLRTKDGDKFSAVRDDTTGEFIALTAEAQIEIRKSTVSGIITGTFSQSAENRGIPQAIHSQFTRAFSDVINFSTDLKMGDTFEAVYEERFNDLGENLGGSKLLYGSLSLKGKVYNRYYFKNDKGAWDYYDENGNSMKQAINVWPMGTTKITSRFGTRRHPILMYTIQHSGVDYGAPIGTPIGSAADGTISYIGTKGGYGRYLEIRHENGYSTAYAHLNSFNRHLKVGSFVKQGDIVAYSGNSGRTTGPHLHFEVIKNGKKVNPLGKDKFLVYSKLKGKTLTRFLAEAGKIKPNINVAKMENVKESKMIKTR